MAPESELYDTCEGKFDSSIPSPYLSSTWSYYTFHPPVQLNTKHLQKLHNAKDTSTHRIFKERVFLRCIGTLNHIWRRKTLLAAKQHDVLAAVILHLQHQTLLPNYEMATALRTRTSGSLRAWKQRVFGIGGFPKKS